MKSKKVTAKKAEQQSREFVKIYEDDGGLTLAYPIGGVRQRKRVGRDRRAAERQAGYVEAMLSRGFERMAQLDMVEFATFNEAFRELGPDVKLHDLIAAYRMSSLRNTYPATVEEALDAFEISRAGTSASHRSRVRLFKERFAEWFGANTRFTSISTEQLNGFILGHLGPGHLPSLKSQDHAFTLIRSMYRVARKRRDPFWINPDGKAAADDLVRPKIPVKEHEIYTGEEMMRLLAATPIEALPFVVIGGFAGLRRCERERMHWRDYKEDFGVFRLTLDIVKGSTPARNVPVQPNLKVWLDLFDKEPGAKVCPSNVVIGWFFEGAKDNALRASYASYRVQQTQDAAKTALECGHSVTVQRQYMCLVYEKFSDEWFSITPAKVLAFCKEKGLPLPKWASRLGEEAKLVSPA